MWQGTWRKVHRAILCSPWGDELHQWGKAISLSSSPLFPYFLSLKEAIEWGEEPGGGSTWFFFKLHISSLPLSLWVTRLHHQVIWGTRILRTFYFSSDQLTLEMCTECLISQQKGTLPSGEQNSHHLHHFPLQEHHLITIKHKEL